MPLPCKTVSLNVTVIVNTFLVFGLSNKETRSVLRQTGVALSPTPVITSSTILDPAQLGLLAPVTFHLSPQKLVSDLSWRHPFNTYSIRAVYRCLFKESLLVVAN